MYTKMELQSFLIELDDKKFHFNYLAKLFVRLNSKFNIYNYLLLSNKRLSYLKQI